MPIHIQPRIVCTALARVYEVLNFVRTVLGAANVNANANANTKAKVKESSNCNANANANTTTKVNIRTKAKVNANANANANANIQCTACRWVDRGAAAHLRPVWHPE